MPFPVAFQDRAAWSLLGRQNVVSLKTSRTFCAPGTVALPAFSVCCQSVSQSSVTFLPHAGSLLVLGLRGAALPLTSSQPPSW